MPGRLAIEQAIINNVKMARSLIRLRHSIEADEELNLVLPLIRTRLETQAQTGKITGLTYEDLRTIIYGMDAE
jgi:hypothetical protein